jgi:wyosine [tRNA(Phe)-imidazoG37] synthetase (radical SAM superfamily)
MTNGVLLTPDKWQSLKNLEGFKTIVIAISIDAATERTFNKLREGGDWQKLSDNLEFISKLRTSNRINQLVFNFVVQNDNYKEMIRFVDMCKKLNGDKINFSQIHKSNAMTQEYYRYQAVQFPEHPNYSDFVSVLSGPELRNSMVDLTNLSYLLKNPSKKIRALHPRKMVSHLKQPE